KYVHEIPKYIYKFVVDKENDAGIVFFTLNNPHVKNVEGTEFCKNQCEEANVLVPNFKDWTQGYTFCCTWNDVKDHLFLCRVTDRVVVVLILWSLGSLVCVGYAIIFPVVELAARNEALVRSLEDP
uniref:Uncharacterized protein n=1 Tax=Glossina palpalis gambiensis TaxID=67801 RepID=A0A1B0ARC1_9MUSC